MPKVTLPIANGFYVSDALPISAQRCVNWQPNVPQTSTITDANLFSTPGLVELIRASEFKSCRGAHVMAEIPYFVIGINLYRLDRTFDSDGLEVFALTDISTDTGVSIEGVERVTMADNGTQLCICAKPDASTTGKSYIFTDSPDTLVEITDPDFNGPADSVVYVDGFFSFNKADGKLFFNSALNDGTAYDAADFGTASADPDKINAQGVLKNQLHMLGSEVTEVFRNIGRSPAPFQRIQGAIIDVGCFSPQTIEIFSGALVFVGGAVNESPSIWALSGGRKQKLSTTAIDNELSKLTDLEISQLYSWVYAESGAFFYGVSLPTTTFVYDSINKRWHERQSESQNLLTQYRVSHMISAYGRILVGDTQDGRIGELKEGVYTDYNQLVRRLVTSQPFDREGDPIFVAMVEAVCESGVGLTDDIEVEGGTTATGAPIIVKAGKDPQITFAWSKDGGAIFQGYASRSLGKIGERKHRQQWRKRPGRIPRDVTLLFEVAAPNKATLIKVEAEIA